MLQPALSRPDTPTSRPTYGVLIDATEQAVADAIIFSASPRLAAATTFPELHGYERFMHIAGAHLQVLSRLAQPPAAGLTRLSQRLLRAPRADLTEGAWYTAGCHLGAAHDLLATNLQGNLPRTAELEDLLGTPAAHAAARRVTELVLECLPAAKRLMHLTRNARERGERSPEVKQFFRRLKELNTAIEIYGGATMWQLPEIQPGSAADLGPVLPAPLGKPSARFESAIDALQALRAITRDQSHGVAEASPASLRDLALLGAHTFSSELTNDGTGLSGLQRVQHAHLSDQLNLATDAWSAAAGHLTRTIQGVTKAPSSYARSLAVLQRDDSRATRLAVATELPRLGSQAADVIRRLHDKGALVSSQQVLYQTRREWRPLTDEQATELIGRFERASATSTEAAAALREHLRTTTRAHTPQSSPLLLDRVAERGLTR